MSFRLIHPGSFFAPGERMFGQLNFQEKLKITFSIMSEFVDFNGVGAGARSCEKIDDGVCVGVVEIPLTL